MKDMTDVPAVMAEIGARAKAAAATHAFAPADQKRDALEAAADAVWNARSDIIAAIELELTFGRD